MESQQSGREENGLASFELAATETGLVYVDLGWSERLPQHGVLVTARKCRCKVLVSPSTDRDTQTCPMHGNDLMLGPRGAR